MAKVLISLTTVLELLRLTGPSGKTPPRIADSPKLIHARSDPKSRPDQPDTNLGRPADILPGPVPGLVVRHLKLKPSASTHHTPSGRNTNNMSAAVKRSLAHDSSAAKKRKVFTPRPPRPAEERLPKLYHGLTDQVEGGHFENAKKTCSKSRSAVLRIRKPRRAWFTWLTRAVLTLDPKSIPAFQTLLFLHLQTDDYTTALDIVSNPPSGAGPLDFERAYCLYRLHREKEALAIVEKLGERGRRVDHLEAQIVSDSQGHRSLWWLTPSEVPPRRVREDAAAIRRPACIL